MAEIGKIFQEYSFADEQRLKEIIKIDINNV
jgi:hypothetical protein